MGKPRHPQLRDGHGWPLLHGPGFHSWEAVHYTKSTLQSPASIPFHPHFTLFIVGGLVPFLGDQPVLCMQQQQVEGLCTGKPVYYQNPTVRKGQDLHKTLPPQGSLPAHRQTTGSLCCPSAKFRSTFTEAEGCLQLSCHNFIPRLRTGIFHNPLMFNGRVVHLQAVQTAECHPSSLQWLIKPNEP